MPDLPPNTVGARIKQLRTEAGRSLSELADAAGVSKSYLWNIENKPEHQKPSGETLYAIADALNTTMSALLGKRLLNEPNQEIDDTLRKFAKKKGLPESDVQMLASIRWRGDPPRSEERWQFVYNALKTSSALDG